MLTAKQKKPHTYTHTRVLATSHECGALRGLIATAANRRSRLDRRIADADDVDVARVGDRRCDGWVGVLH